MGPIFSSATAPKMNPKVTAKINPAKTIIFKKFLFILIFGLLMMSEITGSYKLIFLTSPFHF